MKEGSRFTYTNFIPVTLDLVRRPRHPGISDRFYRCATVSHNKADSNQCARELSSPSPTRNAMAPRGEPAGHSGSLYSELRASFGSYRDDVAAIRQTLSKRERDKAASQCSSEAPGYPLPTCALVGGSKTTVTLRLPQAGHMRRNSSREIGKFGPRVANQRLEVKLLAVDAAPHGSRVLSIVHRRIACAPFQPRLRAIPSVSTSMRTKVEHLSELSSLTPRATRPDAIYIAFLE